MGKENKLWFCSGCCNNRRSSFVCLFIFFLLFYMGRGRFQASFEKHRKKYKQTIITLKMELMHPPTFPNIRNFFIIIISIYLIFWIRETRTPLAHFWAIIITQTKSKSRAVIQTKQGLKEEVLISPASSRVAIVFHLTDMHHPRPHLTAHHSLAIST